MRRALTLSTLVLVILMILLASWADVSGWAEGLSGGLMGYTDSAMAMGFLFTLLAGSLVITILYPTEVHPWRYLAEWGGRGLVAFVLIFILAFGAGNMAALLGTWFFRETPFYWIWASGLCMEGVFLAGSYLLAHLQFQGQMQFWIFGDYPVTTSILRGMGDFIKVFPYVVVAGILNRWVGDWWDLTQELPRSVEFLLSARDPTRTAAVVALIIGVAPVAEELFFRGILYRIIRERATPILAAVITGGCFALLHLDPVIFLPLWMFGYFLGRTYEQTGSLVVVTSMHAAQNASTLFLLLGLNPGPL